MPPEFPFVKRTQVHDFVKLTNEWIYKHRDSDDDFDKERVKIKQLYLHNREALLKSNYGRYVFVTQDKFFVTKFTTISNDTPNPAQGIWGIWFKAGDELGQPTNAF